MFLSVLPNFSPEFGSPGRRSLTGEVRQNSAQSDDLTTVLLWYYFVIFKVFSAIRKDEFANRSFDIWLSPLVPG
jgi:hypothetical protein